ncbi:DgyrCDS8972 [Dimorphilus gyrociliatus]|uniref:DgyrCDS8972 n=1 Tax=Dimorphilus gyrociliatus TaxID=2664684 RepID=A0A7I8VY19_9ANNE|nr:DgyrCDS8972 [Dimorphilus gyrociliatus]
MYGLNHKQKPSRTRPMSWQPQAAVSVPSATANNRSRSSIAHENMTKSQMSSEPMAQRDVYRLAETNFSGTQSMMDVRRMEHYANQSYTSSSALWNSQRSYRPVQFDQPKKREDLARSSPDLRLEDLEPPPVPIRNHSLNHTNHERQQSWPVGPNQRQFHPRLETHSEVDSSILDEVLLENRKKIENREGLRHSDVRNIHENSQANQTAMLRQLTRNIYTDYINAESITDMNRKAVARASMKRAYGTQEDIDTRRVLPLSSSRRSLGVDQARAPDSQVKATVTRSTSETKLTREQRFEAARRDHEEIMEREKMKRDGEQRLRAPKHHKRSDPGAARKSSSNNHEFSKSDPVVQHPLTVETRQKRLSSSSSKRSSRSSKNFEDSTPSDNGKQLPYLETHLPSSPLDKSFSSSSTNAISPHVPEADYEQEQSIRPSQSVPGNLQPSQPPSCLNMNPAVSSMLLQKNSEQVNSSADEEKIPPIPPRNYRNYENPYIEKSTSKIQNEIPKQMAASRAPYLIEKPFGLSTTNIRPEISELDSKLLNTFLDDEQDDSLHDYSAQLRRSAKYCVITSKKPAQAHNNPSISIPQSTNVSSITNIATVTQSNSSAPQPLRKENYFQNCMNLAATKESSPESIATTTPSTIPPNSSVTDTSPETSEPPPLPPPMDELPSSPSRQDNELTVRKLSFDSPEHCANSQSSNLVMDESKPPQRKQNAGSFTFKSSVQPVLPDRRNSRSEIEMPHIEEKSRQIVHPWQSKPKENGETEVNLKDTTDSNPKVIKKDLKLRQRSKEEVECEQHIAAVIKRAERDGLNVLSKSLEISKSLAGDVLASIVSPELSQSIKDRRKLTINSPAAMSFLNSTESIQSLCSHVVEVVVRKISSLERQIKDIEDAIILNKSATDNLIREFEENLICSTRAKSHLQSVDRVINVATMLSKKLSAAEAAAIEDSGEKKRRDAAAEKMDEVTILAEDLRTKGLQRVKQVLGAHYSEDTVEKFEQCIHERILLSVHKQQLNDEIELSESQQVALENC